jgi:hypothetical protein
MPWDLWFRSKLSYANKWFFEIPWKTEIYAAFCTSQLRRISQNSEEFLIIPRVKYESKLKQAEKYVKELSYKRYRYPWSTNTEM